MIRALAIAGALAACQRAAPPPAPTCAAITAHLADIMRQGRPEMGRVLPEDISACEARKLTDPQRRCLMAATTLAAIASCHAVAPGSGSDPAK